MPREDATTLAVRPLTPARWSDLEALFGARGCSVARWCWCMAYRRSGSGGMGDKDANRADLKALAESGTPPGLVAYRGRTPVGWVSLAPREEFKRLARSPVMKPVDEKPVWSIICFVIPSEHRRQGIAHALLRGAVEYARKRGARRVEAYPVDKHGKCADTELWFGTKSMFDRAGFEEVARRKPTRPVVRLALE